VARALSPAAIDALIADAKESGVPLDGRDGLLQQMMKQVIERALQAEMADHLGYEAGDPAGRGSGNNRNGSYGKTVTTTAGPVTIDVPRDRTGDFEPRIVPKGTRRLGQLDEMILSLYARGMTTRDITAHLYEVYGAEVSPALVSKVTDVIADEVASWQARPLDECYPILYIDAIRIKVRDNGHVINKAAHLVIGVDTEGVKNVLGIWLQDNEGAKFWLHVLTHLKHRGLTDALIVCCDGLKGLPEAIEAV
jgi:putative transposase